MQIPIIDLKESLLSDNDRDADKLRVELRAQKTFYLNVMSSPGSGKTSCILRTLEQLGKTFRCGVMEADIDSAVDARKILAAGFAAVQLHTGGMCHLDAEMSRQGLRAVGAAQLDAVILENVGNLVCPAEFDTGACKNVVILSVPEGDDKPLKYPLMFEKADLVLVTKTDTRTYFPFDDAQFRQNVRRVNPDAGILFLSAKTGEGLNAWLDWLKTRITEFHF